MRRERRRNFYRDGTLTGFTLVELLVVIAIIALLIGILLPALNRARESANTIKCATNMRAIGQAMSVYLADNKGVYPAAYVYKTPPGWGGRGDSYPQPTYGYVHWSSYLYGSVSPEVFMCPSLEEGGLPPTNPKEADRMAGQVNDPDAGPGIVDEQVRRCAYTVNEAIVTRNKFQPGVIRDSAASINYAEQYVPATRLKRSVDLILATEFWSDYRVVSDPSQPNVCKSHRTVSGYVQIINSGTDLVKDLSGMPPKPTHYRVTSVDYPPQPGNASNSLSWVGRNHGKGKAAKTNFLYVDGHVDTKVIEDTLKPNFEWGDPTTIYSIPRAVVQP